MVRPQLSLAILPTVHQTVVHMLADAAARASESTAVVFADRKLTYGEYVRCVGGFAGELIKLGARGNRIALICGNSIEMCIATFAGHAAGAQIVPINPIYTARELTHILKDSEPVAIVYDGSSAGTVESLAKTLGLKNLIMVGDGARLVDYWKDNAASTLPQDLPLPGDLATLQYTGGTTGLPKGVNITHGQLSINLSQREAVLPTRRDDESVLCVMPLFHVFAVNMCLHLAAYCRGKLVILPHYKPALVFDAIVRERVTRLPAGPTVFIGLMAADGFKDTDFSSLRTAYSGSAPLPQEVLQRWEASTGCPILEGYGQSEAGPVLSYIGENMKSVPGSVGPPLPRTEIQIVDVETGTKILNSGEIGEIRARGPQIMSGYRNRPEETAQALRDGWLYTGDIGEFDENGYLYIRDRKKDMVITGGYNVYPREIEEVLYMHPDVREAAAIGVPDDYRGEVIKVFVALKPQSRATLGDIKSHCEKNLAKYKVPTVIEIVPAVARTTVGKIDKNALRAM